MSRITVQRQCWQRWPRVLIAERRNDDGTVDERRYVPEGGTRDEWNENTRETLRKFDAARKELDVRLHEESELPNMQAEIDGLNWAVEERDALIRDMFLTWKRLDLEGDWPTSGHNGWKTFERRIEELGIIP